MIIIISGTSASGKTELANNLVSSNPNFQKVVTYTTRSIRPELEVDGIDYNFVTFEEFKEIEDSGKMIESCTIAGNKYGSGYDSFMKPISEGNSVVFVCDPNGACDVNNFAIDNDIPVTSIFLDVNIDTRISRVLDRLKKDQWQKGEFINSEVIKKYVDRIVNMKTTESVWEKLFNYNYYLKADGMSINQVCAEVNNYLKAPILSLNKSKLNSVIEPSMSPEKVLKIDSFIKKRLLFNGIKKDNNEDILSL